MKTPFLCRLGLHAWKRAFRVIHVPRMTIPVRYCVRCGVREPSK